jgi:hypothetical protein
MTLPGPHDRLVNYQVIYVSDRTPRFINPWNFRRGEDCSGLNSYVGHAPKILNCPRVRWITGGN